MFPGETNFSCYFPLHALPSMSQATSNYHFYLSFRPKRHYYIGQSMHPISALITLLLPFYLSFYQICFFSCISPDSQLGMWMHVSSSLKWLPVLLMLSYDTCRIHLLFMFLLFSCYLLFSMLFLLSPVWRQSRHQNLVSYPFLSAPCYWSATCIDVDKYRCIDLQNVEHRSWTHSEA